MRNFKGEKEGIDGGGENVYKDSKDRRMMDNDEKLKIRKFLIGRFLDSLCTCIWMEI